MNVKQSLPIPSLVRDDPSSIEIVRAWVASDGLQCAIMTGVWDDQPQIDPRRAWGIVLADLARHFANALGEMDGSDPRETAVLIAEHFAGEIARPTSAHRGRFVRKQREDSGTRTAPTRSPGRRPKRASRGPGRGSSTTPRE